MRYAKLREGQIEFAPNYIRTEKDYIIQPTKAEYLGHGWKVYVDEYPVTDERHMAVADGYTETDDTISVRYRMEEIPPQPKIPREFSRYKFAEVMHQQGVYDQVMKMLSDYGILWAWNDATVFKEDNEYFKSAIKTAKVKFSVTDEQMEEVLGLCVAD